MTRDCLIEQELKVLETQKRLLGIIGPFSDEARFRILRAVEAYYQPVDPRVLDALILKRAKISKQALEAQDAEPKNE